LAVSGARAVVRHAADRLRDAIGGNNTKQDAKSRFEAKCGDCDIKKPIELAAAAC
jgi:hypothetical protein